MDAPKQPQPAWVEMGRGQLDEKGRVVIPSLIRQAAFSGQERPEVTFHISPKGHILISPVPRRRV